MNWSHAFASKVWSWLFTLKHILVFQAYMHTLECKSLAACLWGVLFFGCAFFTQESLLRPFCSSRVYAKTTNSCDMPEIKQAWILVRIPLEWVCDIELVTRWCLCSLDSQVQMWQVFSDWANIWPHQGLWEVATAGARFSPPPPGSLSDPCHFSRAVWFWASWRNCVFSLSCVCLVSHAARAVLAELINAGCSGELRPLLGPVERVVGFLPWKLKEDLADVTKLWTLRRGRWSRIVLGLNIVLVGPKKSQNMWWQKPEWGSW